MRIIENSRGYFRGTHKGADIEIERYPCPGAPERKFYIRVRWKDGGHLYDGWSPEGVDTMAEAKRDAIKGACLDTPPPPVENVMAGDPVAFRSKDPDDDGRYLYFDTGAVEGIYKKAGVEYEPLYLAPAHKMMATWLPIARADKSITNVQDFPEIGLTLKTSDRYWVRDEDDRVFEASWSVSNHGRQSYWWDWEAESPVDPVEFMPHPLDPRFHPDAKLEDQP